MEGLLLNSLATKSAAQTFSQSHLFLYDRDDTDLNILPQLLSVLDDIGHLMMFCQFSVKIQVKSTLFHSDD